jgi:hypothetical protein
MNNTPPNEETLRVKLQLLWEDLFHLRNQTWRILEVEVVLLMGFVITDVTLRNPFISCLLSVSVVLLVLSGAAATLHHRKVQIRILRHIHHVETSLRIVGPDYIDNVVIPAEMVWLDVLNPKCNSTPIFILRMHVVLLVFTFIYVLAMHVFL